ncbi:MAG: AAA family ATPase [Gammaproteobacteria bacterium]|nr:AAA family ATPase [Gammaproteobacteria bacterium]MBT8111697.1 AAA family ATPase [Gammaproteobacteria bacterium]NND46849.1 AAA family ATPase [Woeseiaceae bacterium]NNL46395.1 AAA family ATPase [Woeseiaceae bacterium]
MGRKVADSTDSQSRLVQSLGNPAAYPHPVSSIEVFETHISWVIATGTFAYKIKKAVKLDFLDFSTLERRRHYCEEELRLNRRWAPELYLDVLPVGGSYDRPSLGGGGKAIEYALKMIQFPQSAQLDNQLIAGRLKEKDLLALAETIAGHHADATIIEFANDSESVRKVRAPMLDNFAPLKQAIDMDLLYRVQQWTVNCLRDLKPNLIRRRKDGFVRECHGDLHLRNLVRLSSGIVPFDCVEFSAELRNIDVISDVAFLVMDLVAQARQDLAYAFLNRYLECTGDYSGMDVFGLYFVYHSMIRAKVAAIRSTERDGPEERLQDIEDLKHNLAVAARWIEAPAPRLIAMHGYSGSGKTWLSSQLMSQLPAIRIRSDLERKRRLGLEETEGSDSEPGSGIYSEKARAGIYASLTETAGRLLEAGFNVIVDASFLRRADRQLVLQLAGRQGVACAFVDTSADRDELRRRLKERGSGGKDASEADVNVLEYQFEHSDPLIDAERERTVAVATESTIDIGHIIKTLRRISR